MDSLQLYEPKDVCTPLTYSEDASDVRHLNAGDEYDGQPENDI